MYMKSTMTIDPAQLTEIHRIKPTKGFARIANLLTAGVVKTQEERETFCAVSILQQVNIVMRSAGVHNIVRLAKDDTVIYEDCWGRENDLKDAIDEFAKNVSSADRKVFNSLNLILEHETDDIVALINIRINRSHDVGEHPIEININGLCNSLAVTEDEEHVEQNMADIFSSQENYDCFLEAQKSSFDDLLKKIESGFVKHMNVDDILVESQINIIRPSKRVKNRGAMPRSKSDDIDPVYMDHYGWDDYSYYAWTWADHCHEHDINCQNVVIMDRNGDSMLEIDEQGYAAGEGDLMNVDTDYSNLPHAQQGSSNSLSSATAESGDTIGSASDDSSGGFFSSLADSLGSLGESLGDSFSSISDSIGDSFGGDGGGCGGGGCGGGCGGG